MSSGLIALLDDVVAIAKASAASLDDVVVQAGKAGTKAAGVVIDDTAVTPKYVVGLSPDRELPIIWHIARGSLKNKLLYLTPAALLLSAFLPWSITPLLMVGGLFLCFEGYEKIHQVMHKMMHPDVMIEKKIEEHPEQLDTITPAQLERMRIDSAIRTDFILSAEIMAITLATVASAAFLSKVAILIVTAIAITAGVYGAVALIVKMDDIGVHFAKDKYPRPIKFFGRGLVTVMPHFLKFLSGVGTLAMLWVGGGIIIHGVPVMHHMLEGAGHAVAANLSGGWQGFVSWLVMAALSAVFGIIAGAITEKGVHVCGPSVGKLYAQAKKLKKKLFKQLDAA